MRFFRAKRGLASVVAVAALMFMLPGQRSYASHTEPFTQKEGFVRQPKDIINTLKDNQSTSFQTLLDGLQQAFDLDKTLKDEGPYTLFAPTDKAFKHVNLEDIQNLFGNKKKLREVMMYHIVTGKADAKTLRAVPSIKTMDGRDLPLSTSGGDLYVGKALVLVTDIPCTNGVIHILDQVVWPPPNKE